MKIFLLVPSLEHGGTERQVAILARVLHQQGYDVSVLVLRDIRGQLDTELRQSGVPIHSLGGSLGFLSYFLTLRRLVAQEKPTVLYSFLPHGNVVAAAVKIFQPACRLVWGIRSAGMPLAGYSLKTLLAYWLERKMSMLPDRVVVNSQSGARDCQRKGFAVAKIAVAENGFDTGVFQPDAEGRARTRSALGIAEGDVAIGMVARIDPVKNHDMFLRAAAALGASSPHARFICIGGGSAQLKARLVELSHSLGIASRVIWTGDRNDVPAVLNALDIVTLCSNSEGFPNAIGEAMACGRACVSTNVGDIQQLFGESGMIVGVRDVPALTQAWRKLMDPAFRQAMGTGARERIVQSYSLDRLLERTLAAFGQPA